MPGADTAARDRIPVTVLTGFLGAGKTTLLNRILAEPHGQRIAVIENEFGEAGIDNDILVADRDEQIVEMNNGCICCTVRGDLIRILGELAGRRDSGAIHFDRVIIETTGLADPAPVAQTFFVDEDVRRRYCVDAVVTVVDAHHGPQQLSTYPEAQEQVAFADRILVSKPDLVDVEGLLALRERLRQMNPRARVREAHFGQTDIAELLDVGGFDLDAALEIDPAFLNDAAHEHDAAVASFVYRSPYPFDGRRLDVFLGGMVRTWGAQLLRYKGVLSVVGNAERVVLQGVHMLAGVATDRPWRPGEKRESVLVFIGRDLPRDLLEFGLNACLVDPARPRARDRKRRRSGRGRRS